MFLSLLFSSPALAFTWAAAIFISLTVHEFSHALVAKLRGDLTAEREGRLTLNPIPHIDPLGLIALFIFGFGWAKPVPFNPYNLKNPRWDSVWVSLGGPGSNLILAVVCAGALRVLLQNGIVGAFNLLSVFLLLMVVLNLLLMVFNIIPIHPLDGSKLFFALFDHPRYAALRESVARYGPQVLFLAIFVSILTPINVFGFIMVPAFAACDLLVGGSCNALLGVVFSAA